MITQIFLVYTHDQAENKIIANTEDLSICIYASVLDHDIHFTFNVHYYNSKYYTQNLTIYLLVEQSTVSVLTI